MKTITPTTNISIRLEKDLKLQADPLLESVGLNYSTAFKMFLKQIIIQRKIPMEIYTEPELVLTDALKAELDDIIDNRNDDDYVPVDVFLQELNEIIKEWMPKES